MPLSPLARTVRRKVQSCTRCPLRAGCKRPVPWRGPTPLPEPRLAVIGEAPGENEDNEGRPFVGRAGAMLEQLMRNAGLQPERAAYLNVVRCRPPGNRDPKPDEIAACAPWLRIELGILRPRFLLLVGRFALSRYRKDGKLQHAAGRPIFVSRNLTAIPIYHPAALLHPSKDRAALEARMQSDMVNVVRVMYEGWWPDDCEVCGEGVDRYDEAGTAWCYRHAPKMKMDQLTIFG